MTAIFLTLNRDHIFSHNFNERPDSAFVQMVDGDNTEIVPSGSIADIDPVNTTVSVAPTRLDEQITLASVANITGSYRYVITEPLETVEVDYISTGSNIAYLKYPLLKTHQSGALFQGTRVQYRLSASMITGSTSMDNCAAIFTWIKNGLSQSTDGRQEFHLCLRSPQSDITAIDLQFFEPALAQMMGQVDVDSIIDESFEQLLRELMIGGASPGDLWSNSVLKRAHLYLTLHNISLAYGQDFGPTKEQWYSKYMQEYKKIVDTAAVDIDRSSTIDPDTDRFPYWRIIRG